MNDSGSSSPSSSPPTSPTNVFFPQVRSGSPLNSVGENPPASPISMDESPCASPDFGLLHHSSSAKESIMNGSVPLDRSVPMMGRNLLHSFNASTEDDSDEDKPKNKKEKKRKEKKRR